MRRLTLRKAPPFVRRISATALMALLALSLAGCPDQPLGHSAHLDGVRLQNVQLTDSARPVPDDHPVQLAAAKNEWASFTLQITGLPRPNPKRVFLLRLQQLALEKVNGTIPVSIYSAYQVLPMPVDVNRAGYVRHTGLTVADKRLPRALLPMVVDNGRINLSTLRNPSDPTDSKKSAGNTDDPALIWVDLHLPPETPPGDYIATCDLMQSGTERPIASVPLRLTVYDFVLPDERHLQMVSRLSWDSLTRLYPNRFEAITPRLMNRADSRYTPAIKTLDDLVTLAQSNRTEVVIPQLQPTAKWPPGRPPQIDWGDFDSVVVPWLKGEMFSDKTPLEYWPLPAIDFLRNFDRQSQLQFWSAAANHFDANGWLNRSAVFVEKGTPGRVGAAESVSLSAEAAQILALHPRLRVTVPLEDDQIQFSTKGANQLIDPPSAERLMTAGTELVFAPPIQNWPADVPRPTHWLRTDLPGLIPYAGAGGDERDARLWAWLAFLRQAGLILWGNALPSFSDPAQPADPAELIWFYPGSWFGVDAPIPTVQLKWLRRAQQDYEYLWLAKQRGEALNATLMARLITKPVEIQPNQNPDPTYALMSGTTDRQAWNDVLELLAKTILLRKPGAAVDPAERNALNLKTLQWIEPQERPLILGRTAQWLFDAPTAQQWGNWVALRLGIDIYNASDNTPDQNSLQWTGLPPGWHVRPQPTPIPALATYHVRRATLDARFNLDEVSPLTHQPLEMTFTNGFTQEKSMLRVVLPICPSDRREGHLSLDGALNEWDPADQIQEGPLVKMSDRPTLQRQAIEYASTPTALYTAWADQNFYLAFKLAGVNTTDTHSAQNFVNYQFRRAWGEDLCELLVQPIFDDNTLGPVLHISCKPNGSNWVERKLDPRTNADPWQPLEGAEVRYAMTSTTSDWRGEIAIPWKVINADPNKGRPRLLRFNFIQHHGQTGESDSWAGPIDFGRDESLMGLLTLRERTTPGMAH